MTQSASKTILGISQPRYATTTLTDPHAEETAKEVKQQKSLADTAASVSDSAKMLKQGSTAQTLGVNRLIQQKKDKIQVPPIPAASQVSSSPQISSQVTDLSQSNSGGVRRKSTFHSYSGIGRNVFAPVHIPEVFRSTVTDLGLSPRGVPSISVSESDLQTSSEPNIPLSRVSSVTDESSEKCSQPSIPLLGDDLKLLQRPRGNSGGEEELHRPALAEKSSTEESSDKKLQRRSNSNRELGFKAEKEKKGPWMAQVKRSVHLRGAKDSSYKDSFDLYDKMQQQRAKNPSSNTKRKSSCEAKKEKNDPLIAQVKRKVQFGGMKDSSYKDSFELYDQMKQQRALKALNQIHREASSGECIVDNPLYNHPRLVIKEMTSHLSRLSLNEPKVTAEKLSLSIQHFPKEHPVIIDRWIELRNTLTDESDICRFNKIIALVLIKPENQNFIRSYLQKTEIDFNVFAKMTLKEIAEDESFSSLILPVMKRLTAHDLKAQAGSPHGTLFRGPCLLSSPMCAEFGRIVWKSELKSLGRAILTDLNDKKASTLCISDNKNMGRFEDFARGILTRIFSMPVPDEMRQMLTERRAQIAGFLKDGNLKDLSRPGIAEVFTLRLLSPLIINDLVVIEESDNSKVQERKTVERKVLVSFCKVLQRLGNEVPFDAREPMYVGLNPLLASLTEQYRTFMDQHSWNE